MKKAEMNVFGESDRGDHKIRDIQMSNASMQRCENCNPKSDRNPNG